MTMTCMSEGGKKSTGFPFYPQLIVVTGRYGRRTRAVSTWPMEATCA